MRNQKTFSNQSVHSFFCPHPDLRANGFTSVACCFGYQSGSSCGVTGASVAAPSHNPANGAVGACGFGGTTRRTGRAPLGLHTRCCPSCLSKDNLLCADSRRRALPSTACTPGCTGPTALRRPWAHRRPGPVPTARAQYGQPPGRPGPDRAPSCPSANCRPD